MKVGVLLRCVLLLPVLAGLASAQRSAESQNRTWDFGLWMATATGEENTNSFAEAQILTAGVSVGRALTGEIGHGWRRGSLEYVADFIPVFVQFTPQRISGTAFEPLLLRWNSGLRRGRMAPFIELGGGGLYTHVNFPPGDTSTFNFVAHAGAGVQIVAGPAQSFEMGCRWLHVSNANLGTRNPEFNGIQLTLGWHWHQ